MGVIRSAGSLEAEAGELREMLLRGTDTSPWKRGTEFVRHGDDVAGIGRTVCVTSAASALGLAIVHRLVSRGYSVRLALENQDDLEKLRQFEMFDGMAERVSVMTASVADINALHKAFDGCVGVFHTSTFIDPAGVSGYSKQMAELEAKITTGVIETCARTPTVRKCVFTSSLLACVWRRGSPQNRHLTRVVVDENCWSDEGLCREKKRQVVAGAGVECCRRFVADEVIFAGAEDLHAGCEQLWFALGKTMAEKAAWRAARAMNLKMVAICPAILTGTRLGCTNSTASISYLKGAEELLEDGVLAAVDLNRAAESHVIVYEAMGSGMASGRYLCFDHIVRSVEEAGELERRLGIVPSRISSGASGDRAGGRPAGWLELSGGKLSRLMSWRRRCNFDDHVF